MISIDPQSRTPIYEQIVNKLELLIIKGVLPPGSQIPSVRALSVSLSINPNTIQKAYNQLEQMGYIFSLKGRGNYVSDSAAAIAGKQAQLKKDLLALMTQARVAGISKETCQELMEEAYASVKEVSHD